MAMSGHLWKILPLLLIVVIVVINTEFKKLDSHFGYNTCANAPGDTTTKISQFALDSPYPPNKSYISFSLYGKRQMFLLGTVRNVVLARHVYPGWRVRVYFDESVPEETIKMLVDEGAEVVNVSSRPELSGIHPRSWRFLIADDENVDVFICRDADSRVGIRERCAVEEWLQSSKVVHIMKDYPDYYPRPIKAGMWGMKRKEFFTQFAPNLTMLGLLKGWTCNSTKYDAYDEFFLRDEIWPRVKDSVFIHDAYTCQRTPGAVGFPCPRINGEYVGQKYSERDFPKVIVNRTVPEACLRRPYQQYG